MWHIERFQHFHVEPTLNHYGDSQFLKHGVSNKNAVSHLRLD